MKKFDMICAVALNGIIGDSATNSIPWHIPADLKRFKEITTGHTVVMGAKTYNSLGRNLPNRRNVVISRGHTPLIATPDETFKSFAEVYNIEREKFFVIGGEHIFGEALKYFPQELHITLVKKNADGDVRFPIEGRRFLQDAVHLSDTTIYNCIYRSNPQHEDDIEYQFTTFRLR